MKFAILAGLGALGLFAVNAKADDASQDSTDDAQGGIDQPVWGTDDPIPVVPQPTFSTDALVNAWADAITYVEKNHTGNNPGNLRNAKGGFLTFGTSDAGRVALTNDLSAKLRKYPSYTFLDIMARYLGFTLATSYVKNSEGDPNAYAAIVVQRINATLGTGFLTSTMLADAALQTGGL